MSKPAYFYIEKRQIAKVLAHGCHTGACATTIECPFRATSHQDCELVTPRMWLRVLDTLRITHVEEGDEE